MIPIYHRKQALEQKSVLISCIVPVCNEAEIIQFFLKSLWETLIQMSHHFEIIMIDDGSTDETVSNILNAMPEYSSIKLLVLSRHFGKETALTAGLEHCKGEVAILLDADFQHPLNLLPIFLQHWAHGYDMVYGIRSDRQTDRRIRRWFSYSFYWIMTKISKINLDQNVGDFRLLDQKVILAFQQIPERSRFMKGLYAWIGFKKIGIPFTVEPRIAGKSTWHFSSLAELAITGITSFSDVPLRIWGLIGFSIACMALVYTLYFLIATLLYGNDIPGFPTLVVSIMFLGGIQLLSIGVLGEYIAKIFTEVKQRPRYLIQYQEGFEDDCSIK